MEQVKKDKYQLYAYTFLGWCVTILLSLLIAIAAI